MKKNKTYSITLFSVIFSLFGCVGVGIVMSISIAFILKNEPFSISTIIILLMLSFIISIGSIYPIYLCLVYYKRDKNTKLSIDYEKQEIEYRVNNKDTETILFSDIVVIREYYRSLNAFSYYMLVLKDDRKIVITSLVVDMFYALPNIRKRKISTFNLIPPSYKRNF